MTQIEIGPDQIQIDADIVAKALKIEPQDLLGRMREGTVTSQFERGEGMDAGRVRLTFFSATRRARITADAASAILSCTAADYSRSRAPMSATAAGSNHDRLDAMLDAALQETFPASDPIAISFDGPE
ncbi:DUF6522 family protein [Roseovarius arcticus]|uniref:DUF6522 family protein n=1 Tax=Roseovarius arcticus TaxID=2547404 RepID=UPI001110129F|nr:DUF6522 family protein [Roseovarius arcticus]